MPAGLKPYPQMKDSGVERLGAVPAHWDVRRLGQIGTLLKGRGGSKEDEVDEGVPCVRYGDLYTTHTWVIAKTRSSVSKKRAREYMPIQFGDVLFAASGETADEIGKSAVNLIRSRACCGGDIILFRPRGRLDARFMGYAADCRAAATQKAMMGRGFTVVHIYPHQIKRVALALPPLPEQVAIARFLDHATSRIERYIRAKEKLIALLEEQKQVIVHDAVTGRIDVRTGKSYPAYKPSGAEWLGDVPVHWEVRRLKWVTHLQRGYDLPSDNRLPGSVPVVSSGGIIDTHVESRCAGPGIVLGRYGSTDAVFFIDEDFWPHNTSLFVTDFRGNHRKWCFYLLQTIAKGEHAGKSAVPGIDRKDLFQVFVPLPPVEVQQEISDRIDSVVHQLSIAISQERGQIDLLREYRTRLIADVVTGKLDVREAASAHT